MILTQDSGQFARIVHPVTSELVNATLIAKGVPLHKLTFANHKINLGTTWPNSAPNLVRTEDDIDFIEIDYI